jgi:ATP-dependent DNA ligase
MLPRILPMLAIAAEPFDSSEHCFEIKYDGVRALAAVDEAGWRLWGRERADYTARYRNSTCCAVCRQGRWWTAS